MYNPGQVATELRGAYSLKRKDCSAMNNRILIVFISFLMLIFPILLHSGGVTAASESNGIAGIAAPAPVYKIKGRIVSVERKERSSNPTVDPGKEKKLIYYQVRLKVSSMEYISDPRGQHKPGEACSAADIARADTNDYIVSEEEFTKLKLAVGKTIEGRTMWGGDEWFHGNFLSNITVISKP